MNKEQIEKLKDIIVITYYWDEFSDADAHKSMKKIRKLGEQLLLELTGKASYWE
jgi:hypothetical protein